jgi:hypothetical protein
VRATLLHGWPVTDGERRVNALDPNLDLAEDLPEAVRRTSDDSVIPVNISHSELASLAHTHTNSIRAGHDTDGNYMSLCRSFGPP